jgi:pyridoxal phosphate enzyme (YggS family)
MESAAQRRKKVFARIRLAEQAAGRIPGQIEVLAVSKRHSTRAIRNLYELGQRKFGENYVSEALDKMTELAGLDIEWHYIGPIQSNKTREIATHFDWVHSIDREKILRRLNDQRPESAPALNCCIQLKVGGEASKSGADSASVTKLVQLARSLPAIRVRGLMAIPPPSDDPGQQRHWCAQVQALYEDLRHAGHPLDTLSMGMSQDLEAAIAQGTTLVRVGTALFGPRQSIGKENQ